MATSPLTGAQKTKLRSLGQTMPDAIEVGRAGLTPAFYAEMGRLFGARELVKLRFSGGQDRQARATLIREIETKAGCQCAGAVGHTALFFRTKIEG
jgi:RNA-binding protein